MVNKPNEDLYNPKEVQIFSGMCNRIGVCTVNTLLMFVFSCPSLIMSIISYIDNWRGKRFTCKIRLLLRKLNDKEANINDIITNIIESKQIKYFEFIFLLIYIVYHRIKALQQKCTFSKYCEYDLYFCTELLQMCLSFYFYGTTVINDNTKIIFINLIKRTPNNFTAIDYFDKNYYNDFIKYISNNGIGYILFNKIIIIIFTQLIRDAALLDNQNTQVMKISELIGEPIFYHDFYRYKKLPYNTNSAKIIFVLNDEFIPVLGKDNYRIYNNNKFPEFIDIYINNAGIKKLLRYVLVCMYIHTSPKENEFHAESIGRFYNNGIEKYYRISNEEVIECGTKEMFSIWNNSNSNYRYDRSCKDIKSFESFAMLAAYHAYKWL